MCYDGEQTAPSYKPNDASQQAIDGAYIIENSFKPFNFFYVDQGTPVEYLDEALQVPGHDHVLLSACDQQI